MRITLKSADLTVEIALLGAELQSIKTKSGDELLWQGDPKFWPRKAPVLFPTVGRLKGDLYTWKNQRFEMKQHGFARNQVFELEESSDEKAVFVLRASETTLAQYPFQFEFRISYELKGKTLITNYSVSNPMDTILPFSVGGHPAFALHHPIDEYHLKLDLQEPGLLKTALNAGLRIHQEPCDLKDHQIIELNDGLFETDALVFEELKSTRMTLVHGVEPSLSMTFKGFPFFGIWTKVGAPYLCLEPWAGIADHQETTGRLEDKQGIMFLPASQTRSFEYSVEFF